MPKTLYLFELGSDRFIELANEKTFGLDDFPDDRSLAKHHFRVTLNGDQAFIEDLGSKTGTRTSQGPLAPGERRKIQLHELVEAGEQRFIFTNQKDHRPSLGSGHNDYTLIHGATSMIRLETQVEIEAPTVVHTERPKPAPEAPPQQAPREMITNATPASQSKSKTETKPGIIGTLVGLLAVGALAYYYAPAAQRLGKPSLAPQAAAPKSAPIEEAPQAPAPWEATPIDQLPGYFYVKNSTVIGPKPTFATFSQDNEVLARALSIPRGELNAPFAMDSGFEDAADQACSGSPKAESVRISSPLPIESLIAAVAGADGDAKGRLHDEGAGPLPFAYYNARLSTMRFPIVEHKIQLASSLIDCRDPAGKRAMLAQHRATLFHLIQAKAALQDRIRRHEQQILSSVENKYSREANKGVHLATQIKALRNMAVQLTLYMKWLNSPQARAELGADGLDAFRQAALSFAEHVRAQREEFESKYAEGRFVYPSFYPEIPKETYLLDTDLLFLSVY